MIKLKIISIRLLVNKGEWLILQKLNVELNVPIPNDLILIKKVDYEEMENELNDKQLAGVWWNMRDLEKRLEHKNEWIKENILYPSRFRKILDVNNGGFVHYPERKGQPWTFQATKMTEFLERYFSEIFSKKYK